MSASSLVPLSVVVLAYNEERNLSHCLSSVAGWAEEIFVVDSGSTDQTCRIAQEYGATVTFHSFESHSRQWIWALKNLPISTEWVLGLDADQRVTPELRNEITEILGGQENGIAGYFVKRKQIFRGKWIRHGGYYPKYMLKLFRPDAVWVDENDLVDHHFRVHGRSRKLHHDIIEDNKNESNISNWIEKHNRYAQLQAREEFFRSANNTPATLSGALLSSSPDERILWLKSIWRKLPLYFRSSFYFFYRYFLRLGFLDGKEGFIFHFLQAFWFRLLVDINLEQMLNAKSIDPTTIQDKVLYSN